MTNKKQFLAASIEEQKRVESTLRDWRNKFDEAKKQVTYWQMQYEAITSLNTRLDIEISREESQ